MLALTALAGGNAMASPEFGAPGAYNAPPENVEARSRMADVIFAPIREAASAGRQVISQMEGAAKVQFQPDEQSGALYFVFANQSGVEYPVDGAGAFIIKRSLKNGSFLQAKIFVQDGPGTFLRLFPQGDRTLMDVYLFGEPFQMRIALPVSFDHLLTAPLSSIMGWSAEVVNWPLVLAPAPGPGDRRLEEIVRVLTSRLPALRDMNDGAMDGAGRMVYIASGAAAGKGGFNCSGFAKWVVDALYAPLAGKTMDIAPLKSRNAARNNTWSTRFEEELDPYFGLDWSRGLARTLAQAQTGIAPTDEQIDVRDSDRLPYVKDVGYPVSKLEYLLYFLARSNPGAFYVGSVNAPSKLAVSEGTPMLRQHHHVIVLFPYFDLTGDFQVAVMERNARTSIASLTRRYGNEYVHLERIESEGTFSPPRFE
ncbi:MAG: hypothetical protein ABSG21_02345 [Spirochaetia bacterium]